MTTKNVAQNRMNTGGAKESRTPLIGFAIQSATLGKYVERRKINNLRAEIVAGTTAISHIAADFYQMPTHGLKAPWGTECAEGAV